MHTFFTEEKKKEKKEEKKKVCPSSSVHLHNIKYTQTVICRALPNILQKLFQFLYHIDI